MNTKKNFLFFRNLLLSIPVIGIISEIILFILEMNNQKRDFTFCYRFNFYTIVFSFFNSLITVALFTQIIKNL